MPVDPLGRVIAVLLTLDGFVCAIGEVVYLMWYLGPVPFPVSALVAAVGNVLLVLGMHVVSGRPVLPLAAWVIGFFGCILTGPGGDILLPVAWQTPLLLVAGLVPAALVIRLLRRAPQTERRTLVTP